MYTLCPRKLCRIKCTKQTETRKERDDDDATEYFQKTTHTCWLDAIEGFHFLERVKRCQRNCKEMKIIAEERRRERKKMVEHDDDGGDYNNNINIEKALAPTNPFLFYLDLNVMNKPRRRTRNDQRILSMRELLLLLPPPPPHLIFSFLLLNVAIRIQFDYFLLMAFFDIHICSTSRVRMHTHTHRGNALR